MPGHQKDKDVHSAPKDGMVTAGDTARQKVIQTHGARCFIRGEQEACWDHRGRDGEKEAG